MSETKYTTVHTNATRRKALTKAEQPLNVPPHPSLPVPVVCGLLPAICGTTQLAQAVADLDRTLTNLEDAENAICALTAKRYELALRIADGWLSIDHKIRVIQAWDKHYQIVLKDRQELEIARSERKAYARSYSRQRIPA